MIQHYILDILFTLILIFCISDWWIQEWIKAYSIISNRLNEFISPVTYVMSPSSFFASYSSHHSYISDNNIQLTKNVLPQDPSLNNSTNLIISSYNDNMDKQPVNVDYYLGMYILIGSLTMLAASVKSYYMFMGSLAASKKLHSAILDKVLLAKIRFFDTTPIGKDPVILCIFF